VLDHCRALDLIVQRAGPGEIYNIAAGNTRTSLEIVHRLLEHLGKPESLIQFVSDRPGHDRRYALDVTKITGKLGWKPVHSFEETLTLTVDWYLKNRWWWHPLKRVDYTKNHENIFRQQ